MSRVSGAYGGRPALSLTDLPAYAGDLLGSAHLRIIALQRQTQQEQR